MAEDCGFQPTSKEDFGFQLTEQESPIKKALKGAAGAGEAGLEAIPKMILGAGGYSAGVASDLASDALTGKMPSLDKAMKEGERRQHQVTDWRLFDEAKPVEEAIGKGFGEIQSAFGKGLAGLSEMAINPVLIAPDNAERPEADQPGAQSLGEAGANFLPLPFLATGKAK